MQDYAPPIPMFASHQDVQQGGTSGYRDMGGHGVLAPPPGHPTFPFPVHGAGGYDEPAKEPARPVPQLRQGVPASAERHPPLIISGGYYNYEPGTEVPIKPGAFINVDAFRAVLGQMISLERARQLGRAIASPITVPLFYIVQDPRSHLQGAFTCNVKTDWGNFGPSFYYEREDGEDVYSMSIGPKAYWKRFPLFQGYFGAAFSTDENNRGQAWALSPSVGKTSATMGMNPIIADGQTYFQFSILNRMAFTFARDTIGFQWNVKDFRDDLYRAAHPRKTTQALGKLVGASPKTTRALSRWMHKVRKSMVQKDLDYMCGAGLYVTNPDFLKTSAPIYDNVLDPYLLPAFNTFRKHIGKSPLPAGYHGRYKDKTASDEPPAPGPVWEVPAEVRNFFSSIGSPGLVPLLGSLMPSMAPDWEGQERLDPEALITQTMMTSLLPLLAMLSLEQNEAEASEGEGPAEEPLLDMRAGASDALGNNSSVQRLLGGH